MNEPTIDHSCSYHCDRPDCIKAQRDELRDKLAALESQPVPVEPELVALMRRYPLGDNDVAAIDYIDTLQSALQRAQEELDNSCNLLEALNEKSTALISINERLKHRAEKAESINRRMVEMTFGLWKLLDDIDTLDDAAKENDEAFRDKCYHIQRKRFDILSGHEFDAMSAELLKEVGE